MLSNTKYRLESRQAAIDEIKKAKKPHRMVAIQDDEEEGGHSAQYRAVRIISALQGLTIVTLNPTPSSRTFELLICYGDQLRSETPVLHSDIFQCENLHRIDLDCIGSLITQTCSQYWGCG